MKTIVNFILDKSGSMCICQDATISGFNKYLKILKKQKSKKNKIFFTLTLFDTLFNKLYTSMPINRVKPLNHDTYIPDGMTALYDAVVETVEETASKIDDMKNARSREEKIHSLVIIMTDGQENSSTRHNQDCLRELISGLRKSEDWTFVFLGANQDSWLTASSWGFSAGNIANWQNTSMGATITFNNLAQNTVNLCNSLESNTLYKGVKDNFFAGVKDISQK